MHARLDDRLVARSQVGVDSKSQTQVLTGSAAEARSPVGIFLGKPVVQVAVIGLGAWGLAVLERLIAVAGRYRGTCRPLLIHVIEPNGPGVGVYSSELPDYLIMNTPCGQISMYPGLDGEPSRPYQLSLFQWALRMGYRWQGDSCAISDSGNRITPNDFLPRRLVGEYLQWFYTKLVGTPIPGVQVLHHRTRAVDVEASGDLLETLHLADGQALTVDHVVFTLGHISNRAGDKTELMVPYDDVFRGKLKLRRGSRVAIAGMGLAATDVAMGLTLGRGGHFTEDGAGLRYVPSGREPLIRLYSRSGLPQCAKAAGMRDTTTTYRPGIWTDSAVSELRLQASIMGRNGLSWKAELLPLLLGEMNLQYYTRASASQAGESASTRVRDQLLAAWRDGRFQSELAALPPELGTFDALSHLYPEHGRSFSDSGDYQCFVGQLIRNDLAEALVPGGASPVKMAYEVLRFVRDGIRRAVEFGGLDAASHLDFFTEMRGRINRVVQGPPAKRVQQLVALAEAGLLTYPYGPAPSVQQTDDHNILIESTQLATKVTETVDAVVCGHLEEPLLERTASVLVLNLLRRGRLRPLSIDGIRVGAVELTRQSHPVSLDGIPQSRLWLFGALTEGTRYFTNVIPSPGSRVGPFQEAYDLARSVLVAA